VKNADDKLPSSLKQDLIEKASPLSPSKNRFTIRDSMYLDVGKPEFNGKIDSISNGSSNNSLYLKGADNLGSNNNSVSSFARQTTLSEQKKQGQSRSFKGHNLQTNNSSFLKAAIFNNMKNGDMGLDSPNTPKTSGAFGFGFGSQSNATEDSASSGEVDDIGDENCKIQQDFDKINEGNSPKYPSQMLHSKMRSSHSFTKK